MIEIKGYRSGRDGMGRDGEKEVCLMSYMIENILIVTINRNPSHFANAFIVIYNIS